MAPPIKIAHAEILAFSAKGPDHEHILRCLFLVICETDALGVYFNFSAAKATDESEIDTMGYPAGFLYRKAQCGPQLIEPASLLSSLLRASQHLRRRKGTGG